MRLPSDHVTISHTFMLSHVYIITVFDMNLTNEVYVVTRQYIGLYKFMYIPTIM